MIARWASVLLLFLLIPACGGGSGDPAPATRSFHMGFTSWPYAATIAAVDDTWAKIHAHGDMITIHLDQGVPWPEAFAGTAYPSAVEGELQNYSTRIAPGKTIFLQVACLDNFRQNMAGYWSNAGGNQPRPGVWAGRSFNDVETATAYTNWMADLIARYHPTDVNYAVEVTELAWQDPVEFAAFATFAGRVYGALKALHPSLPLFCSVSLKSPGSAEMTTIAAGYATIAAYNDVMAISAYPYAFFTHANRGDPGTLPVDWLSQVDAMAPGKPIAFAETAWIAETLDVPSFGVHVVATPADQAAYVARLLSEADARNALFISWFCIVDYDTLWATALGSDPVAKVWRDTGLYDGTVTARPALATWDSWLGRGRR